MFLLNFAKSFKFDENFSFISDQASPSGSSHAALEPPTPPRTPISTTISHQLKSAVKSHNNNNDESKENLEENLALYQNRKRSTKRESDYDDCLQKSSHFNDDSNFSEDERGGRESVVSGSMPVNGADESDHEESDCASSFDSSKLSMKHMESFLAKSNEVS